MSKILSIGFIGLFVGHAASIVGETQCVTFSLDLPLTILAIMGIPWILGYFSRKEEEL